MGLLKGLIGGLLTVLATLTQPQTNGYVDKMISGARSA
jgi:hypothetical protein